MSSPERSLRFKLSLWFVLVFFAIQALLFAGVVLFRRETIQRSIEDELTTSAEAMVENILAKEIDLRSETVEAELHGLVPDGSGFLLYALRDEDGGRLVSWNIPEGEDLPFSAWEIVPQGMVGAVFRPIGPELASELTGTEERLQLATIPFRYQGGLYYFQAAVRDQALERLLGPFFDLIVVGVPVGVLAALAAAWIIAGRAVSPIRRLALAARKVSPTSLDHRFHVTTRDEEVTGLEEELNSALERIEAGYRAQDHFISNVSHELKTPIAVLLTEAQVAKIGKRTLEKGYGFVDRAEREMKRLARLVESFLVIARSDLTRERPTDPVAINDLILDCVQHCKPLTAEKGVRLIPHLVDEEEGRGEALVLGDVELLQSMLENLLRNAIEHTPSDTTVEISAARDGDRVRITVEDRGPGIPAGDLERVFDRFVQARRTVGSASSGGSGLGLAIANSVAHLHRGSVSARNVEGGGCVLEVTLPLRRARERS